MTPYFLLNWHNRCFHNTWVSRLCKAACTTCICVSSMLSSEFWVSTIICVLHFFFFFFFLFPFWIWLQTCEQWVLRSVGWYMKINETLYVKAREKNLYWNFGKYITMKICRIFQSRRCIPMCTQDQNSQMYQAL